MKLKKECLIIIKDEVNIEIKNLEPSTRRKLNEKFKFFIPGARFSTAYKYGRWDGKISYFGLNGDTYYNLLEDILPVLEDDGYIIDDKTFRDERTPFNFDIKEVTETYLYDNFNAIWPEDHMLAGEPILLRDYQVEAINKFIKNPQSIEELCTSFGKTILTAVLSHITEPYGKSLVVVPNKDLVKQTYKDYENLGLDVGMYYGDEKQIGHKHTITTWQSVEVLKKNKKEGKITEEGITFDDILNGVITIIIDETHGVKGNVLRDLLTKEFANVPFRWGVTGTIPKEKIDQMALLTSIGPCIHKVKARDLMDKGHLAECFIKVVQILDYGEYIDYHQEKDFLLSDKNHLQWISMLAQKIMEEKGSTLILFNNIETGDILGEYLPDSYLVNGSIKSSLREEIYDKANKNNNVIVRATYGCAAVGINIPNLRNIILIEGGKSNIRVIQSIGRGIRKSHGKMTVDIWDICSTLKYSNNHMKERIALYKDAEYDYSSYRVDIEDDIVKNEIQLLEKKSRGKKPKKS